VHEASNRGARIILLNFKIKIKLAGKKVKLFRSKLKALRHEGVWGVHV
jgi:hypothetical protein